MRMAIQEKMRFSKLLVPALLPISIPVQAEERYQASLNGVTSGFGAMAEMSYAYARNQQLKAARQQLRTGISSLFWLIVPACIVLCFLARIISKRYSSSAPGRNGLAALLGISISWTLSICLWFAFREIQRDALTDWLLMALPFCLGGLITELVAKDLFYTAAISNGFSGLATGLAMLAVFYNGGMIPEEAAIFVVELIGASIAFGIGTAVTGALPVVYGRGVKSRLRLSRKDSSGVAAT